AEDGIRDGHVTGVQTCALPISVKQIQGKPGTKVKLTIEREGVTKPLQIEVARDVIEIETVMGAKRTDKDEWDYYVDPANKIAYEIGRASCRERDDSGVRMVVLE